MKPATGTLWIGIAVLTAMLAGALEAIFHLIIDEREGARCARCDRCGT